MRLEGGSCHVEHRGWESHVEHAVGSLPFLLVSCFEQLHTIRHGRLFYCFHLLVQLFNVFSRIVSTVEVIASLGKLAEFIIKPLNTAYKRIYVPLGLRKSNCLLQEVITSHG